MVEGLPAARWIDRRGAILMSSIETHYEHIVLDEDRAPRVSGTTMKVVELVTAQQAYGWSPEELAFQFPYLTLGQTHSALAYYWDHRQELDDDITRRLRRVEELRKSTPTATGVERLGRHSGR
jgi:uncharacterized protein (DUF433 family)